MASVDLSWAVRSVDSLLRRCQGITEISDDEDCILRISVAASACVVTLSDGVTIAVGDPVIRIHYWNERLPVMPPEGPNAAWAGLLLTRLRHSFDLLADRVERDPRLAAVRGIHAAPAFADRFGGAVQLSRICARFGWDVLALETAGGFRARLHDILDGIFIWGLIRAFNPAALKHHGLSHRRIQVWMSRRKLLSLYGDRPARGPVRGAALVKDVEPI